MLFIYTIQKWQGSNDWISGHFKKLSILELSWTLTSDKTILNIHYVPHTILRSQTWPNTSKHSNRRSSTYQRLSWQWLGKDGGHKLELPFQLHAAQHCPEGTLSLGQSFPQYCQGRNTSLATTGHSDPISFLTKVRHPKTHSKQKNKACLSKTCMQGQEGARQRTDEPYYNFQHPNQGNTL